MPNEEATKPPTLTWAPWPTKTPLGFNTNTWPLALMLPRMLLRSAPVTRLSVAEVLLGWLKRTDSSAPTEKLRQLMTARSVLWLMVVAVPLWLMLAAPRATEPPSGPAKAGPTKPSQAAATAAAKALMRITPWAPGTPLTTDFVLPRPLAVSHTACQQAFWAFQTMR